MFLADGRSRLLLCLAMLVLLTATSMVAAEELVGWPKQIDVADAKVLVYQPQLDSFEGDSVAWRAAVSVSVGEAEPGFGAVWVQSRIVTDFATRMVEFDDIRVERVRFPEATEQHRQKLVDLLEREIPTWNLTLSLDRLSASMDALESGSAGVSEPATQPPQILFVDEPAVLITLDGKPQGWAGYRQGYRHEYGHADYAGQHQARDDNPYRSPANRGRVALTSGSGNRVAPTTARNQANNVYTDRNGDVYRRNDDGWQKRDDKTWSNADLPPYGGGERERPPAGAEGKHVDSGSRPQTADKPSSLPAGSAKMSPQPSSRDYSSSNLNRDYKARSQGTQRTNNFRSSGGSRGGGGRRR